MQWSYSKLSLELLFTFKISRNSSDHKTNFIVSISQDGIEGQGECAPNIRYGESLELVEQQLTEFIGLSPEFADLQEFSGFLKTYQCCQSVKNAIESCFVNYLAKRLNLSIPQLLKLPPPSPRNTMFTIPIMESGQMQKFYSDNNLYRFNQIKLKINKETGLENINTALKLIEGKELIVDANESFASIDEYLFFEKDVKSLPILFMEQPLPSHLVEEYIRLKKMSHFPIFGDESIISDLDMKLVSAQFHGVNVKMMKTGGYFEAIRILQEAKNMGLKTMLGCMVESTLGIFHAIQLCSIADYLDLDSFMYVRDEPFKLVRENKGLLSFD